MNSPQTVNWQERAEAAEKDLERVRWAVKNAIANLSEPLPNPDWSIRIALAVLKTAIENPNETAQNP